MHYQEENLTIMAFYCLDQIFCSPYNTNVLKKLRNAAKPRATWLQNGDKTLASTVERPIIESIFQKHRSWPV